MILDPSIPSTLLNAVTRGEAVLFLGAGASYASIRPDGTPMPVATGLRDALADEFLDGECKNLSLEEVATLVENEVGRGNLERFVAQSFSGFEPTPAHCLLPAFRWKAVFTINYDLLVEQAYERASSAKQQLRVFHRDQNSIERELAGAPDPLPLFKLHGSINRIHEPDAPLILTTSSYVNFESNRKRLFRRLEDLAVEYPLVFVGTRLADPHIKAILDVVSREAGARPFYYYVNPQINRFEAALLNSRRISPLDMTFDDFGKALADNIDQNAATLYAALPVVDHSIQKKARRTTAPPQTLIAFLTNNVDHVHETMPAVTIDAKTFYKGESHSWGPIQQGLDVERTIYSTVMIKLISFKKAESPVDVVILKGVSGSGKTVFSRRIAYDLATQHGKLVLYCPPSGLLRVDPLIELFEYTGEEIFVVLDQAADHLLSLRDIMERLEAQTIPVTFLLADTQAALGSAAADIAQYARFSFELRSLDEREIDALLGRLESNRSLGVLAELTLEERRAAFVKLADRQLLVALYEATQGRPLEEILVEEYHRIALNEAQELYLLVCTLNRFRIPVRAGLVSRVMGISFRDFEKRFLGPLDGIVFAAVDPISRDYAYRARHAQIADIVFRRVLDSETKQVEMYMQLIEGINITYSSDNDALRRMLQSRSLRELSASATVRRKILDVAERATDGDAFVLQQQALLEMSSPHGDLRRAAAKLEEAQEKQPRNVSLKHSQATLFSREAQAEKDPLARRAKRNDARRILRQLSGADAQDPYVQVLLADIAVNDLQDLLRETQNSDDILAARSLRLIEDAEKAIAKGLSVAPDFEGLIRQSVRLRNVIGQSEKGRRVLKSTVENQPHLPYAAMAYAKIIQKTDPDGAIDVLTKCLKERPSIKYLNQALFETMLAKADDFRDELAGPLHRSFTPEDQNVPMHVHAIRYHFIRGELETANKMRDALEKAKMPWQQKLQPRFPVKSSHSADGRFQGVVVKLFAAYGFVESAGLASRIFMKPMSSEDTAVWDILREGSHVSYELWFTAKGPLARAFQVLP